MRKIDLRSGINVIVILIILVFILPLSLWKGCNESNNLVKRGKKIKGKIIDIRGIKGNTFDIEYNIDNKSFIKTRDAQSEHNKSIGDEIFIIIDSLNYEVMMIEKR
jgi:hypothetical protein